MEIHPLLLLCGFLAGAIDAIAGGGGLIQLPALLVFQPQLPLGTILGCNKVSSFTGTSYALYHYNKSLVLLWNKFYYGIIAAFVFSFLGSKTALYLDKAVFTPYIIVALVMVLIFTLLKKDNYTSTSEHRYATIGITLFCALIGFYDGCIGPGTGSFLVVMCLVFLPFDYLQASAHSKIINWTTNLASLLLFVSTGNIAWGVALPLAASNLCGSFVGSRIAIHKGAIWVKVFFTLVVLTLLLKLSYSYLLS